MIDARFVLQRLVRGYPGGDQDHPCQCKLEVGLLRTDEVTKVWRIERSAEDPDAHGVS